MKKSTPKVLPVLIVGLALGMVIGYGLGPFLKTIDQPSTEYVGRTTCPQGFVLYDMQLVDYSFCYAADHGTPTEKETAVSPSARQGTSYSVTFEDSDDMVWIETADFALTGDHDAAPLLKNGYQCLTAASDEIALENCFNDEVVSIDSKTDAQGVTQFSVHIKVQQFDGGITDGNYLFIPDIKKDGSYHLQASSGDFARPQANEWGIPGLLF